MNFYSQWKNSRFYNFWKYGKFNLFEHSEVGIIKLLDKLGDNL